MHVVLWWNLVQVTKHGVADTGLALGNSGASDIYLCFQGSLGEWRQ